MRLLSAGTSWRDSETGSTIEAEFVDMHSGGSDDMWEEVERSSSSSGLPSNLELDDPELILGEAPMDAPTSDPLGAVLRVPVWNFADGDTQEELVLENSVFGVPLRVDIVHRVVEWQRANRRNTQYKTKRVGDIRGSGRKILPQKGSGKARQGERTNAHMRGGMKAHGPVLRDWSHDLPKKIRRLGLRVTLSSKRRDGRLFVVDNVGGAMSHRTKDFLSALQQLAEATDATLDSKSTTFVTDPEECSPEFERAIHNVKHVQWLSPQRANVLDIVRGEHLVLSRCAVDQLTERLRPE